MRNARRYSVETLPLVRGHSLEGRTLFGTKAECEYYFEPLNPSELSIALEFAYKKNLKTRVIGMGTHTIISDDGLDGLLVSTRRMRGMTVKGNLVSANAGVSLDEVINTSIEHNLVGIEELGGIPGTIAAAVLSGASSHGISINDCHFYTDYMTLDGKIKRRMRISGEEKLLDEDGIILSVTLSLKPSRHTAEARVRKEKFVELFFVPPASDFIGQVFKDPVQAKAEDIIRSLDINFPESGKCAMSRYRPNCMFCFPTATSRDATGLIDKIRREASEKLHVSLEPSVTIF